jgi:hypothetical protein
MSRAGRGVAVWCLGVYAVLLPLFVVGLDACPPWTYNGGRHKWRNLHRLLEREPNRPLVVMLGSSRTDAMFMAGCLDGRPGPDGRPLAAYNFGAPAAGPAHEYLYLRAMLREGIRPRLLLVEFSPLLLNERHRGYINEEDWNIGAWRSLSELLFLRPYFARPCLQFHDWFAARVLPWYMFRWHLKNTLLEVAFAKYRPSWNYVHDAWGHQIPEGPHPWECARRLERTRFHYRPTLQMLRLGQGPSKAMRDLVDCCYREHIPLALVIAPESSACRRWYSRDALDPSNQFLRELRAAYGVPVIDARYWVHDKDFQDGHHVMAGGAVTFTNRLIRELQPLLSGGDEQASCSPPSPR